MKLRAVLAGLLPVLLSLHGEIPAPTDAPKPRTPEESAAAFSLPEGFRMEVIASEPLIASPSGVCWDENGRMFVSELHGYNLEGQLDIEELNKSGELDTKVRRVQADERFKRAAEAGTFGAIKLLRDTNGDGRMDQAQVWAADLPPVYGMVPARGGIIVAAAPHILYLADRDGAGRAEVRETFFTGFRTGPLERGINNPQWGPDGWIYFGRGWSGGKITGPKLSGTVALADSDFRIRPDGSAIEPVTGGTHTFGFAMLPNGDRFVVTTVIPAIYIAPLPWKYLARNPDAAVGSIEAPTGDRRVHSLAPPHPWRQKRADDPAYFKYYRDRYGPAESEAAGWFTSACGPMVYQDPILPGLQGQYFVCEPSGNLIHRAIIEADGSALKLRRPASETQSEFAATRDPWSHPIALTHGPDGCIWVVDYYREIIEDYSAIPRHLQQQYGLYAGHDRGRIYRLTHQAAKKYQVRLGKRSSKELVAELAHPLLWQRQTAQRLLLEGEDSSVAGSIRELLHRAPSAPSLALSLWTLHGLGQLKPSDLQPYLSDPDRDVRLAALQLTDAWLGSAPGKALLETVLERARTERDPRAQIQLALSLGESNDPRAFAALARFARHSLDVRWMDAAILSSLRDRTLPMLQELMRDPAASQPLFPALAQAVANAGRPGELERLLVLAEGAVPDIQAALLTGLAKDRRATRRKVFEDEGARAVLARLAASTNASVAKAARELESASSALETERPSRNANPAAPENVSSALFAKFVSALPEKRDLTRGHDLFLQACANCHKMGPEGNEVGPDLIGQLGMPETSLLQDLLMPSARIRPGYETTALHLHGGEEITGLLKADTATSLTVALPGGVEQQVLRKDLASLEHPPLSLMPSFAETLSPEDAANLLGWLKAQLQAPSGR